MTIIVIHRDKNLQLQMNNVLACISVIYICVISKITCLQFTNFDIYLSLSLNDFSNHESVGLPFSDIIFCYKHIYKKKKKLRY